MNSLIDDSNLSIGDPIIGSFEDGSFNILSCNDPSVVREISDSVNTDLSSSPRVDPDIAFRVVRGIVSRVDAIEGVLAG